MRLRSSRASHHFLASQLTHSIEYNVRSLAVLLLPCYADVIQLQ
jgi:hypothetical protein